MANKPRSYFYPVLSPLSSDYLPNVEFSVDVVPKIVDSPSRDQIAVDYEVNLNSKSLRDFIIDQRAVLAFDVYCGDTMYRELVKTTELKGEIQFPAATVKGRLEIQPLVVVVDNSVPFLLEDISPEYKTSSYELEVGVPLAIASSISIPITFALSATKEMVKIRLEPDVDKNSYAVDLIADQIVVNMGVNAHAAWTAMFNDPSQKSILFFSVYKDCVLAVLEAVAHGTAEDEYDWMTSFSEELAKRNVKLPSQDASFADINEIALKILGSRGFERFMANVN
jgi:hypothetical protein